MEAVLKIYSDIGDEGITPEYISDWLDQNKEATDITVRINSRGGDVTAGWAIHDLLVNSGKRIKTVGESKIYSIATIIFLAGTEREIFSNADGLIHNPFIPPYTLADQYGSEDLIRIAEALKQEESKILDFYVSRTNCPVEKLAEYMKEDTKLSAQDMLDLGFATKIIEPVKAYAYVKLNNNFMNENVFFEKLGTTLDAAIAKIANFSRLPAVDQTMKDKDGKEFKLDKESGAPAVGDKASPDGTYVMADGATIVIEAGVVKSVSEEEAEPTELDKANALIAELQAKITASEAEKPNLVAAEASFKAKEAEAVALVTELTSLKNSYKPDSRSKFSAAEKVGGVDLERVKELRKKISTTKSE